MPREKKTKEDVAVVAAARETAKTGQPATVPVGNGQVAEAAKVGDQVVIQVKPVKKEDEKK